MREKIFLIIIGLVLLFPVINAQNNADIFAKSITAKQLKEHVHILASDSCAGRNIGTLGLKIAQDYIVSQLEETSELKPYFRDTWLQPFFLFSYGERISFLQINNSELINYKDYMYTGAYDDFYKELTIVFVGYGRDVDFENLDVKGKAVFTLNNNLRTAIRNARTASKYGVELTIVANPENINQFETYSRQLENFFKFKRYRLLYDTLRRIPTIKFPEQTRFITINTETVKKITAHNLHYWDKNKSILGNDSVGAIKISTKTLPVDTLIENNIVAYIPGTDANESIIIGAHYDHLGAIENKIYYGADDNASGTAALLELTKAFSTAYEQGFRPKRNIIFVAFSAEEGGLCGSEYYVDQLENSEDVKLMINMDMIGRVSQKHIDESGHFYFIGNNLVDSIYKQNDLLCEKHRLTPDYTSTINGSDHKPFADIGIPTIFYFDGKNQDYHKTTDTADKIDYKRMERITRLVFEVVWNNSMINKVDILKEVAN